MIIGTGTLEERTKSFLDRMAVMHPDIEVLGTYAGTHTPIECRCKIHNHIWNARPHGLMAGSGCPICGFESSNKKRSLTHEEFIERMKVINPNIQILSEYISQLHTVLCRCEKHDYEWNGRPGLLLKGRGCRLCGIEYQAKTQTKTHQQYVDEVAKINPHIEVTGTYTLWNNPITCKCKICGYEWETKAKKLSYKALCPLCSNQVVVRGKNDLATTHPELLQYIKNIDDAYTHCATNTSKICFKCPTCGEERMVDISCVVKGGYRCQSCDKSVSIPNRIIRGLIKQLPVEKYVFEYNPEWVKPYRYDVYFKYKNKQYIVEMDGGFHFRIAESLGRTKEDFKKAQERDKIKDQLAKEHNIIMIRIKCDRSSLSFITSQIQASLLSELFDLSQIEWQSLMYYDPSLMKQICDYYNQDESLTATQVGKDLGIYYKTVARYLNRANTLGLCKYNSRVFKSPHYCKPIICTNVETNDSLKFQSVAECLREMNKNGIPMKKDTFNSRCKSGKPYFGFICQPIV